MVPRLRRERKRPGLKERDGFTFTIEVPHYECALGDHLALVGSIRSLGTWSPERGVALTWQEGHSWVGSAQVAGG